MIVRKEGYSDSDMLEYLNQLEKVVGKTIDVKVGRGKDAKMVPKRKYSDVEQVLANIEESKKLYSNPDRFAFRDYQLDIIDKASRIITDNGFVYLAMEVRTGKTLTSLGIADKIGAMNVLFVTKKKAMTSIMDDFEELSPSFNINIINYESLHKVSSLIRYDVIILDEAHSLGAFPKPNGRALSVKNLIAKNKSKVILLSGTPTPESYSQMYHQVYGIPSTPFKDFKNFYRFCDKYVKITEKHINGIVVRDYSGGSENIIKVMKPYTINFSQSDAGFMSTIKEHILEVDMMPSTYKLISDLSKTLVVEGKSETILADTPVKLMMKLHQLYSGTIKFESGNSMVLDISKAEFICKKFYNKKIGIFYKFKEELEALKKVFGDSLTTDLGVFKDTDKSIALQIVSGREGISLKEAVCLVYYNIDFSATSYWQSKDRMTTKERMDNTVYWVFAKDGIEHDIYRAVTKKKDYTLSHFKKTLDNI
jgi:hypothetical protein